MQLIVAAVGQRMPGWVQEAWSEYARRFSAGLTLELKEVPLARRSPKADIEALRKREGEALLASVPADFRVVALDERGRQWSTLDLAAQMEQWMQFERGACFMIGGPDGLTDACRARADDVWSLSRLTLPHPLVRVVLAEQLYRAWTVTRNHPYHRS